MSWWAPRITGSEGQRFDQNRKARLATRVTAMKAVVSPLIQDIIQFVIDQSEEDISKTTFYLDLDKTLKDPKSASYTYFKNVCGKSKLDLLPHEWNFLVTSITNEFADQDVKVQFYNNNHFIHLDYTNVSELVEKRLAALQANEKFKDSTTKTDHITNEPK